jgi:hypothetical protein
MFGESLREIGVLLLVFVPLDGLLRQATQPPISIGTHYLQWLSVFGKSNIEIFLFAVAGFFLIMLGIRIEHEAELPPQRLIEKEEPHANPNDGV